MSSSALPTLSSAQVREVDSLCEERFGISTEWLMEAAGWKVARFIGQPASVVCGVGNNAGDGFSAARHLHRWGRLVSVSCVDTGRLRGPAAKQLEVLRRLGVAVMDELSLDEASVVVDAVFGTGLSRAPEGRFAEWIEAMNGSGKPIIAIDVPSGLDADSGVAYSPTVNASVTITLGLPKQGLRAFGGRALIADIGIPNEAYAAVGVEVPADLFAQGDLIPL